MKKDLFISIDDTDVEGGEGTGRLARRIVRELNLGIEGVTRHQLYIHPSIKYTKRNSCNVILARGNSDIHEMIREIVIDKFQDGSDPGLAIASEVQETVHKFGRLAQREVLTKKMAMDVAEKAGVYLEEIGGSGDGIIGALAGLGLCSTGDDGRYIMLRGMRDLSGTVIVEELQKMGINTVVLDTGRRLKAGIIAMADRIRPSRIGGRPVLFVRRSENVFYPVVL